MLTKEIIIKDIQKADEHPLAKLVQIACQYSSEILLKNDTININAKSIMGMLAFQPTAGTSIQLSVNGEDEADALDALEKYLLCE